MLVAQHATVWLASAVKRDKAIGTMRAPLRHTLNMRDGLTAWMVNDSCLLQRTAAEAARDQGEDRSYRGKTSSFCTPNRFRMDCIPGLIKGRTRQFQDASATKHGL